jgi:transposase
MEVLMDKAWVGVDAGKEFHWAHALDASGAKLFSRRVENDEGSLSALIDEVLCLAGDLVWAIDQPGGGAALLLALLWEREQKVFYIPGLVVDRARDAYRAESKTDERDARLIAEQARMREDFSELAPEEGTLAELRLLLARRRDLVVDQTRAITRLREMLLSLFPALERTLELGAKGSLVLLLRYQTPAKIRRTGRKRLASYLKGHTVKGADELARKVLEAAKTQTVELPAQEVASRICAELAGEVLALKERLATVDGEIASRFSNAPRPGYSLACPASVRSSGPSSLWPSVIFRPSRALISSPPTPVWSRLPATPARGWATTAGCVEATRSSSASLPVGFCQPALLAALQSPLRPQEEGGQEAHPGSHRARQTKGQRPVGDAARRNDF